jgi:hypothetical protein
MLRPVLLVASLAVLAGCGGGQAPTASRDTTTTKTPSAPPARPAPRTAVEHLDALQRIADDHDGTRAAGSPGERAAQDYVAGRLRAAGWTVRFEPVGFPVFDERRPPRVGGLPRAAIGTLRFSGAGTARGPLRRARGLGCTPGDWAPIRRGDVALVDRGTCTFASKEARARRAGAVALLVVSADGVRNGTLGGAAAGRAIPSVLLTPAAAARLAGRVTVRVDADAGRRRSRNVVATRPGTGRAVAAGAHLDSVPEGPGANDNATGSAALLELAERLGPTRRPVTLGFWTAEELGLIGSRAHVRDLRRRTVGRYVNLDMVGTSDARLLAASPDTRLRRVLAAALRAQGLRPRTSSRLNSASDHAAFARAGIPSAFVHTGLDSCYHRACDTAGKVDRRTLARVAAATTRAVRELAG